MHHNDRPGALAPKPQRSRPDLTGDCATLAAALFQNLAPALVAQRLHPRDLTAQGPNGELFRVANPPPPPTFADLADECADAATAIFARLPKLRAERGT